MNPRAGRRRFAFMPSPFTRRPARCFACRRKTKPGAWWRALLTTAVYTGLRRGTLFSLRMTDIDWQNQRIAIPAERMKSRRPHVVCMHASVIECLIKIRTDRDLVFEWPYCQRHFHTTFNRLLAEAAIPEGQHFGLQTLRRTFGTMLYEVNPGAARLALGHTDLAVTEQHYIRPDDIVARAIHGLPTFEETPSGEAA